MTDETERDVKGVCYSCEGEAPDNCICMGTGLARRAQERLQQKVLPDLREQLEEVEEERDRWRAEFDKASDNLAAVCEELGDARRRAEESEEEAGVKRSLEAHLTQAKAVSRLRHRADRLEEAVREVEDQISRELDLAPGFPGAVRDWLIRLRDRLSAALDSREDEGGGMLCANCGSPDVSIYWEPEAFCSTDCLDEHEEKGCPQEHSGEYRAKDPTLNYDRVEELCNEYSIPFMRVAEERWGTGDMEELCDFAWLLRRHLGAPVHADEPEGDEAYIGGPPLPDDFDDDPSTPPPTDEPVSRKGNK